MALDSNSKTTLEHATCARLPSPSLGVLAGLRSVGGISVLEDGDHAWVFWEVGDDRVLRAVLPVAGAELFEKRGEAWHRSGRRLPSFETVPVVEPISLERALTPSPFEAEMPEGIYPGRCRWGLSGEIGPRPTSAALCPLAELGRWADSATTHQIEAIRGATRGDSALLLGRGLPSWSGSTRYWGDRLLVPIGFETRPNLPESTLLEAIGGSGRELFRLVPDPTGGEALTVESIPLEAFRPLTRAGVRLAILGRSP